MGKMGAGMDKGLLSYVRRFRSSHKYSVTLSSYIDIHPVTGAKGY